MDDSTLYALKDIGVPAAIVASVFATLLFKIIDKRLALISGTITILSIAAYTPLELWPKYVAASEQIKTKPDTYLHPNIKEESKKNKRIYFKDKNSPSIAKTEKKSYSNQRDKELSIHKKDSQLGLYISNKDMTLGKISETQLNNIGYAQASSKKDCNKPYFLASSKKVYLNNSWPIGDSQTALGDLQLHFKGIKGGRAIVSLQSSSFSSPQPENMTINNKSFDTQTFQSTYEATVQVREANFEKKGEEWAAFNLIVFE